MTHAEEQQLAKRSTTNPQAYDLLLKGRSSYNQGTGEALVKAVGYYQQAGAIDPNYTLAHAALADAYRNLAGCGVLDPQEALPKARAAALRSLELDERLAEAHSAMARIKMTDWDWTGAERSFKRACELNPNSAEAHSGYACLLAIWGGTNKPLPKPNALKISIRFRLPETCKMVSRSGKRWIRFRLPETSNSVSFSGLRAGMSRRCACWRKHTPHTTCSCSA